VNECRRHALCAIQRLNNPQSERFGSHEHQSEAQSRRIVEMDEMDGKEDVEDDDELVTNERRDENGAIHMNSLSHFDFRDRIVEHFDILHRQRHIRWPTMNVPKEANDMLN